MGIAIKNERQSKEGSADIRYQDALYVSDEVLSTYVFALIHKMTLSERSEFVIFCIAFSKVLCA